MIEYGDRVGASRGRDLQQALRDGSGGSSIVLLVRRDDNSFFVPVEIP